MWDRKVPINKYLSCAQIFWMDGLGGQYKGLIYKHASEIVRGCKAKKGKKSKPKVENFTTCFSGLNSVVYMIVQLLITAI